jgi:hypothetical protein
MAGKEFTAGVAQRQVGRAHGRPWVFRKDFPKNVLVELSAGGILDDDLVEAVVERLALGGPAGDDSFAQMLPVEFDGAVVTIRVVAGAPAQHMAGPAAAALAVLGIDALTAIAPQPRVIVGAAARKADAGAALP